MKHLYPLPPLFLLLMTLTIAGCTAFSSPSRQLGENTLLAPVLAAHNALPLAVHRQALAQGLYELAYSAQQNAIFLAASGGRGEQAYPPKILRLHPETLAIQAEIALERKGFGIALDDEANRLYVGNTEDASITVIDTRNNQVLTVIQLAQKINQAGSDDARYPHALRELVLDQENKRLYALGLWFKDSVLYVVNTDTLTLETVIPGFGFLAAGITLDASRDKLYVSNLQGQLYTVNTLTLGIEHITEVPADQLINLVLDSKRQRILATDQGISLIDGMRTELGALDYRNRGEGNRVLVLDQADGSLLHSIPTDKGPLALMLDEPRDRLYVTNRESGTVTVYDAQSYLPLQTIDLPEHPNSLALNPQTGAVYVSIKNAADTPADQKESVARLHF